MINIEIVFYTLSSKQSRSKTIMKSTIKSVELVTQTQFSNLPNSDTPLIAIN